MDWSSSIGSVFLGLPWPAMRHDMSMSLSGCAQFNNRLRFLVLGFATRTLHIRDTQRDRNHPKTEQNNICIIYNHNEAKFHESMDQNELQRPTNYILYSRT